MTGTAHPASARWRLHAACRGDGPALFYDPHPTTVVAAQAICAACPVRAACRTHALDAAEPFGVWGGLAADDRPTPLPEGPPAPGPAPKVSDDELYDLFIDADPDRVALDQLLEHVWLPTATAYSTLQRAVRLGVIEHCGRNLYPTRH
ncbi:MAG TPA: WhiB family transcriptional regulator [Microthrixaceae bacterium]|jgi:WhiB family redox-sensing transcriptional regulator|nr:WhiB family transcriptional regulator [Microthrixaceae bacterium]